MAALLQPGEGAARRDRRDQGRRIDGLPEGRDGLVAVGLGQRLDGAEDAVHPGLGAAAQRLLLGLHGVVGAAVHPGQELVTHLDQLVEQALARFDQGADDERVAFGLGKPPEVAGIVAAAELTELTDDLGIDPFEADAVAEQLFDQTQTHDVAFDGGGRCTPGSVLEPEQTGAGIALRHLQEKIDGLAQGRGQLSRDLVEQAGRGASHLGGHNPLEGAGRRQHDPPVPQPAFHPHQEFGRAAPFESPLAQPVPEILFGLPVEALETEIATDAQSLGTFRLPPSGPVEEQHRSQADLPRQMIDDAQGSLPIVLQEPAMGAQHAQLERKAAPVVVAAAAADLDPVGGCQAPVPGQLVFAGLGRQNKTPSRADGFRKVIIGRHSGASAPGPRRGRRATVGYRWRWCPGTHDRGGWPTRPACRDCRAGS